MGGNRRWTFQFDVQFSPISHHLFLSISWKVKYFFQTGDMIWNPYSPNNILNKWSILSLPPTNSSIYSLRVQTIADQITGNLKMHPISCDSCLTRLSIHISIYLRHYCNVCENSFSCIGHNLEGEMTRRYSISNYAKLRAERSTHRHLPHHAE